MLRLAGPGAGYGILLLWSAAQHSLRSSIVHASLRGQTQHALPVPANGQKSGSPVGKAARSMVWAWNPRRVRPCSLACCGRLAWYEVAAGQGTVRLHAT